MHVAVEIADRMSGLRRFRPGRNTLFVMHRDAIFLQQAINNPGKMVVFGAVYIVRDKAILRSKPEEIIRFVGNRLPSYWILYEKCQNRPTRRTYSTKSVVRGTIRAVTGGTHSHGAEMLGNCRSKGEGAR